MGVRIAHLRIAHQVANPEVGNPEGIRISILDVLIVYKFITRWVKQNTNLESQLLPSY